MVWEVFQGFICLASTPEQNKDLESRELKAASGGGEPQGYYGAPLELKSVDAAWLVSGTHNLWWQDTRNSNLERATPETLKWRDTLGQSPCGESNLKIQLFRNKQKPQDLSWQRSLGLYRSSPLLCLALSNDPETQTAFCGKKERQRSLFPRKLLANWWRTIYLPLILRFCVGHLYLPDAILLAVEQAVHQP